MFALCFAGEHQIPGWRSWDPSTSSGGKGQKRFCSLSHCGNADMLIFTFLPNFHPCQRPLAPCMPRAKHSWLCEAFSAFPLLDDKSASGDNSQNFNGSLKSLLGTRNPLGGRMLQLSPVGPAGCLFLMDTLRSWLVAPGCFFSGFAGAFQSRKRLGSSVK